MSSNGKAEQQSEAMEIDTDVMLYGGAMHTKLPCRFADMSKVRVIPDHQEVFADNKDQSIIFEILQHEQVSNDEAVQYHFNDLAASNEASSPTIKEIIKFKDEDVPNLPKGTFVAGLIGIQEIAKYNEKAKNKVVILVACIRLPNHATDILLHYNVPIMVDSKSSSFSLASTSSKTSDVEAISIFKKALLHFTIRDWNLFNG